MDENQFYQTIGQNISSVRIKKGINQEELAKRLNLSRPSIANIEKGNQRPSVYIIVQIALILGVEITDLIPLIKHNPFESINIVSLDINKSQLNNDSVLFSFLESI